MSIALLCVFAAAVCFGIGSVLQAAAAHAEQRGQRSLDPRLLMRLLGRWRFLAGLAADFVGYIAMLGALRLLPLFLVEGAVAGSLAVTAVIASRWLGLQLRPVEWGAVGTVCVGLTLLATAAGVEGADPVGLDFRVGLVVAVFALAGIAVFAGRLSARVSSAVLGAVAGLGFGVVGLASRVLPGLSPEQLVSDLASYVIPVASTFSVLCYATALQRGSVTAATAGLTIGETVLPAVIGVTLLGDGTRPGFAWVAVAGFVTAVLGALALARFGEIEARQEDHALVRAGRSESG